MPDGTVYMFSGINNAHNQNEAHAKRLASSSEFLAAPGNER